VIPPTLVDAITYSSLLGIMTFGLTFVRITTGVWNVAHGAFVTVGAYVVFTCTNLIGGNPYLYLPLAFIMGSITSIIEYLLIIEPLRKREASTTLMLVSTISFDLAMLSIINIYADYLQNVFNLPSKNFIMKKLDFTLFEAPGIFWVSFMFLIAFVIVLYFVLHYTKVGVALRACVSNPALANITGINVIYINLLSWFISGGLAGVAGGLLPLWIQGKPIVGDSFLALMFCVSIVGGVEEIYGTVLGGFLVGFTQTLVTLGLYAIFGAAVIPYKTLIPMMILVLTLLFAPKGLAKINWKKMLKIAKIGGPSKWKV